MAQPVVQWASYSINFLINSQAVENSLTKTFESKRGTKTDKKTHKISKKSKQKRINSLYAVACWSTFLSGVVNFCTFFALMHCCTKTEIRLGIKMVLYGMFCCSIFDFSSMYVLKAHWFLWTSTKIIFFAISVVKTTRSNLLRKTIQIFKRLKIPYKNAWKQKVCQTGKTS